MDDHIPPAEISEDNKHHELFDAFSNIIDCVSLLKMQLSDVQCNIRNLEKKVKKEIKMCDKEKKTRRKHSTEDKPLTGFARPMLISSALCKFMKVDEGTKIARTTVTKALANYIKEHDLKDDKGSKNKINADKTLIDLLEMNDDDAKMLTFFNMQKHLNKHFLSTKKNTQI